MKGIDKIMKITIILMIVVLSLTSCSYNNQISSDNIPSEYTKFDSKITNKENIKYLDVSETGNNVSYSILNQDGIVETETTYFLKENSFQKFIKIANYINMEMEYTILTFVNFKQVRFEIEGKSYDSFTAFIAQNTDLQIPIKLNNLNKGLNDILFLIVLNPNKNLTNPSDNEAFEDILYLRRNVIWGNTYDKIEYEYKDVTLTEGAERPVMLHEKAKDNLIELAPCSLDIKQSKEAFITVANRSNIEEDYAVILLADWRQVPILNQETIYIKLPSKFSGHIPINTSFDAVGLHKLVAIIVKSPYHYENFRSIDVESSQWVNIDVK